MGRFGRPMVPAALEPGVSMKRLAAACLCVITLTGSARSQSAPTSVETLCGSLSASVQREGSAVFVRSYEPGEHERQLPLGLATTAFVYDNALTAIALIACGDMTNARRIGNALSLASRTDRTFHDGRVRNAYRAGVVENGPPALPGWWDEKLKLWAEDPAQDGTSTGNVAWAGLALLTLHQATGEPKFLEDASRLLSWITQNTSAANGGFTGGLHGFDPVQTPLRWKSTEHNVDVFALAAWLYRLRGAEADKGASERAYRFVESSFHPHDGHFDLGTGPEGNRNDAGNLALDVQLWPWMAIPSAPKDWQRALRFAEAHLGVDGGFDFNGDRDGMWVEGTAQASLGYRIAGNRNQSDRLIEHLKADQAPSGLLNATRREKISTGLSIDPTKTVSDFFYYRRPHIGATAWAVLAAKGWNPFTGKQVE